jgi:putative oxidoreductase
LNFTGRAAGIHGVASPGVPTLSTLSPLDHACCNAHRRGGSLTLTPRHDMATPRSDRQDLALTLLRLVVGAVFIAHGLFKLLSFGLAGTAGFFAKLGIPLPNVAAPIVIAVEVLGGIALVLGAGVRVAGVLLAVDMLGAIVFAKLHGGFFAPNGFEFELTLLVASLALAVGGAGAPSIDAARNR